MRFSTILSAALMLTSINSAIADQFITPVPVGATQQPASPTPAPDVAPLAPINGAVTLQYKFTPQQDLKYGMQSTTTGTINMAGRSIPMTQTMTADYHMFTIGVDKDGNGTLQMGFDNVVMNMNLNGQAISIPSAQMEKAMGGFTMVMSPQGKLLKITTVNGSPAADAMKNMGSPSQLGNLAMLPEHPVNIGDSWRGTMNLAALGAQTFMRMTLNGVNSLTGSHIANVGVKLFMTFSPNAAQPGSAVKVPMNGTMNGLGTMGFDIDNGYQTSFSEDMDMAMNITPPANPNSDTPPTSGTAGMKISTTMHLLSANILPDGQTPFPAPTPSTVTAPAAMPTQ